MALDVGCHCYKPDNILFMVHNLAPGIGSWQFQMGQEEERAVVFPDAS